MPYLPNVGALTKSFIKAITQSQPRRVMLHHIHRNQDFSTTQEYKNWLKGHNEASGSGEGSSRGQVQLEALENFLFRMQALLYELCFVK